jgi:uncharacterized protein (DUF1330 family)
MVAPIAVGVIAAAAQPSGPRPAYLLSNVRVLHPEQLGPFRQASGPLTLKAGSEALAAGDPALHVLEGAWNRTGTMVLERYPSMDGLLAFWNSHEYQEARTLVASAAEVDFVVAVEAGPTARPPAAPASGQKPAYLIASSRPIHPDLMGPYRAAAGPLALKAGLEVLASGNPAQHVLEGAWTHAGSLTIERYRSMDDLLAFWNSTGYQEAQKLRSGMVEMNFIVAIDGR